MISFLIGAVVGLVVGVFRDKIVVALKALVAKIKAAQAKKSAPVTKP